VQVAKSWYKTPYRGWTCLKGIGCDCGQLLKGVYQEAGLRPPDGVPTPKDYSLRVAQHQASTDYIDTIGKYFREIPESEVLPGDIVVYKLGLAFAHAAIIVKWPEHIIHSLEREGVHAGHGMNNKFRPLQKKFYTLQDQFCGTGTE
jgi:cell wall-associated NlpC family hydrolase